MSQTITSTGTITGNVYNPITRIDIIFKFLQNFSFEEILILVPGMYFILCTFLFE